MNYQQLRTVAKDYGINPSRKTQTQLKSELKRVKYPHKFKKGQIVQIEWELIDDQLVECPIPQKAVIKYCNTVKSIDARFNLTPKYTVCLIDGNGSELTDSWGNKAVICLSENELTAND